MNHDAFATINLLVVHDEKNHDMSIAVCGALFKTFSLDLSVCVSGANKTLLGPALESIIITLGQSQ
jgi:hypothetical protein